MFALRMKSTGKLMTALASSNSDGDFCGDVQFRLSTNGDCIWVVQNRKVAERAAVTNTPWYNANANTPSNDYVNELEVVELFVK